MKFSIRLKNPINYSIFDLITMLLFINSGFYISSCPVVAPVYIFFYIAIIYYTVTILIKLKFPKLIFSSKLALIAILYIGVSQFIICGKPIAIIGSIATFSFYILGTVLFPRLGYYKSIVMSDAMLLWSSIFYGLDTFYRLSLFNFNLSYLFQGMNFYAMKTSTLLYADTNTVGINVTVLIFLAYYLYKKTLHKKYIKYIVIFSLLNLLSFSRASIFATIITVLFISIFPSISISLKKLENLPWHKISIKKIIANSFLFILAIISTCVVYYIIAYISTDPSFGTKIELFNTLDRYIHYTQMKDLLFGIGFNTGRLFEFGSERGYAHTYLLTYICETGLCGYILVTSFLISVLYETKKNIIILLPFFIIGISLISHAQLHLFYTVLALIWFFEHYNHLYVPNVVQNKMKGLEYDSYKNI